MLKKRIKFEDFDGNQVEEEFYFNLTKAELIELELGTEGGLTEHLTRIAESNDGQKIISEFKRIILLAVGHKSPDGRRFIKSEQIREEFTQTNAFSVLFMELATDAGAAVEFINGCVPSDLRGSPNQLKLPESGPDTSPEAEELRRKIAEASATQPPKILPSSPEPATVTVFNNPVRDDRPVRKTERELTEMSEEELRAYIRQQQGS